MIHITFVVVGQATDSGVHCSGVSFIGCGRSGYFVIRFVKYVFFCKVMTFE